MYAGRYGGLMSAEPGLCRLLHLPVVYAGSEHRNPLVSAALSVGVKLPHASAQVQDEEVFSCLRRGWECRPSLRTNH